MKSNSKVWRFPLALALTVLIAAPIRADVVDFGDLSLSPDSYWHGPDPSGTDETVTEWWGSYTQRVGSFQSGGVAFSNKYNLTHGSWVDWAYSNVTDNTTPDYGNQHSAFPGGGFDGPGDIHGVAFGSTVLPDYGPDDVPSLVLPDGATVAGAYFTNATYPALVMRDGDVNNYAKQFGGPSGADPDWFLLTVKGADAADNVLPGQVDFYLADYTGSQDYIVDDWTWVDLSSLAGAKTLFFNLTSSDTSAYGMNTPAYFAMDNLTLNNGEAPGVPEPSAFILGVLAAAFVMFARRWGRAR